MVEHKQCCRRDSRGSKSGLTQGFCMAQMVPIRFFEAHYKINLLVPINRGLQYRPPYITCLVIETPEKGTPNFGMHMPQTSIRLLLKCTALWMFRSMPWTVPRKQGVQRTKCLANASFVLDASGLPVKVLLAKMT